MNVVVVESPAKAKTINKYLGKNYVVLASYGHIRDLPSKNGSVRPDDDFALEWEVDPQGAKRVRDIAEALKGAERLILATDPDREGEAISWHVLEALTQKKALKNKAVERVTFNAITKDAVLKAMAQPRAIDMELVDAYLARRALDYLVGFTLSPVLWRKLPGARSAGRVQSVALRLIAEREMEIERFRAQEYWTLDVDLASPRGEPITARLAALDGKRLKKLDLADQAAADAALAAVRAGAFTVSAVEAKPVKRNPPPPFTTSTLQQEAARKLGFSATRTMQAAQRLYEGVDIGGETQGLITYMRTDGVQMDPGAIQDLRRLIGQDFGERYVPEKPRHYATKAKNAQEAHEAIRPTDPFRQPGRLRLEGDLARLYELIWKRAAASQMEAATLERTTIDFAEPKGRVELRASGQVVLFDGYFAVYQEGQDDAEDEESRRLPKLAVGEPMRLRDARADQHFTEPPPRFSEASLVKKLEELGIGRPSTYASILEKLRERDYVRMDKNRFIPEDKGRLVTIFLENFFRRYVEYDFTAGVEQQLDSISAGDLGWKEFLRSFWKEFHAAVDEIGELRIGQVIDALDQALGPHIFPPKPDGADPRLCPLCGTGRLSMRLSKTGAFVGCSNYTADPSCRYSRPLAPAAEGEDPAAAGERTLGEDPATGLPVLLRVGRFGPYVQLGEAQGEDKPKRSSLPKGWEAAALDLERALKLLALPREIGPHPEDGAMMLAGLGRFGPYVQHGKIYASLPSIEDAFEVGVNRAVALLDEKKSGGRGRFGRGAAPPPLKELGAHPEDGEPVKVMSGRYGPYVAWNRVFATLPKDVAPAEMTLDRALPLLAKKAESAPKAKRKAPAKKAAGAADAAATPAKKPAAKKKAAAKKPAAKSAAPKAPRKSAAGGA